MTVIDPKLVAAVRWQKALEAAGFTVSWVLWPDLDAYFPAG